MPRSSRSRWPGRLSSRWLVLALIALQAGAAGCPRPTPAPLAFASDGPALQLEDDDDRAFEHDEVLALADAAPDRAGRQHALVAALGQRLARAGARRQLDLLASTVDELASMWRDRPGEAGPALTSLVPALRAARDQLAGAGLDLATVRALVLLAEAEPAGRAAALAEVDEIAGYLDDLDRAEVGPGGEGARFLPILVEVARQLPLPWLVDRSIVALRARQATISALLDAGTTPSEQGLEVLRAHRDVLSTSHHIAGLLARADRIGELAPTLLTVRGIGSDDALSRWAGEVERASAAAPWLELASALARGRAGDRSGRGAADDEPGDADAAFRVAREAVRRFPADDQALAAAAEHAARAGRDRAARDLAAALARRRPDDRHAVARASEHFADAIGVVGFAGRLGEARRLHHEASALLDAARIQPTLVAGHRASLDVALGRSAIVHGYLDQGLALLAAANRQVPSPIALEVAGTVALKRGQPEAALPQFAQALRLTGTDALTDVVRRGTLHRLAAEAATATGQVEDAAQHYLKALGVWSELGQLQGELPAAISGQRLVESGRALWAMGAHDKGLDLFEVAMAIDGDGADTHEQVVAFLLGQDRLDDALAAVHRALPARALAERSKAYMALWVLAETRRAGRGDDPVVRTYLAGLDGGLWWHQLARAATGRAPWAGLHGGSRLEQAELAYYRAMLGGGADAAADLRQVVASDLVLFYEYDAALRHLAAASPPPS